MQQEVSFTTAAERKYPERLYIAIARDHAGRLNPIVLSWVTRASNRPPMLALALGRTRHSLAAMRHSKAFVLAMPAASQTEEITLFSSRSGKEVDKLALAGSRTQPAKFVDGVLLADAVGNFECRLVGELEAGDHVLLLGEVLCSYLNTTPLQRVYALDPTTTLGILKPQPLSGSAPAPAWPKHGLPSQESAGAQGASQAPQVHSPAFPATRSTAPALPRPPSNRPSGFAFDGATPGRGTVATPRPPGAGPLLSSLHDPRAPGVTPGTLPPAGAHLPHGLPRKDTPSGRRPEPPAP